MSFGNRLREARRKKKLTQIEVADRLGIDDTTISKYENDKSEPDNVTLQKMADLYAVSVDYLLGRSDLKNKTEYTIPPDKNEFIIKEIVEKYGVDLEVPGNREKLEDLIKIVFHKYKSEQES